MAETIVMNSVRTKEIDNASLNFSWQLGDYTLSGVLGYSDYSYDAAVNIAGTTEVFYFGTNYEEYEQTSGEIRLASPTGQTLEWMIGAYYHDADLYTDQPNTLDVREVLRDIPGLAGGIGSRSVIRRAVARALGC